MDGTIIIVEKVVGPMSADDIQKLFDELGHLGVCERDVFKEAFGDPATPPERMSSRSRRALGLFLRNVTSADSDVERVLAYATRLKRANGRVCTRGSHPVFWAQAPDNFDAVRS